MGRNLLNTFVGGGLILFFAFFPLSQAGWAIPGISNPQTVPTVGPTATSEQPSGGEGHQDQPTPTSTKIYVVAPTATATENDSAPYPYPPAVTSAPQSYPYPGPEEQPFASGLAEDGGSTIPSDKKVENSSASATPNGLSSPENSGLGNLLWIGAAAGGFLALVVLLFILFLAVKTKK